MVRYKNRKFDDGTRRQPGSMPSLATSFEQELLKFGLSENQAKIYLLLVAHKELRVQQIVDLALIPRSSVYESLKGLYELGIAEEIVEENYKKVRPYSLGAIHHGLDDKLLHFQKLKQDLDELEKAIPLDPPLDSVETIVRYYKGRSGARQLYWNSLKAANKAYVYSDWGRGRYVGMKFYETFVAESRHRKISERVLINATPPTLETIRKFNLPGSPIMRTAVKDIRVIEDKVLAIKGDALIYDNIYAHVYLKSVEINGFEIENNSFAEMQRSIHEAFWAAATPVIELL